MLYRALFVLTGLTMMLACGAWEMFFERQESVSDGDVLVVEEVVAEAPAAPPIAPAIAPSSAQVCKKIQALAAGTEQAMDDTDLCEGMLDGYKDGSSEMGEKLSACVLAATSIEEIGSTCEADFLMM